MSDLVWVFEQGGWVSYALAIISTLLWTAVIIRTHALRGVSNLQATSTVRSSSILARFIRDSSGSKDASKGLERLAERSRRDLLTMRDFITTLVAVAPLLGLLGTVIGMVEMFGSMQGLGSTAGETTVAGGISTALVTTQLGLVIAAPGLFASYMLNRQQLRRERDVNAVVKALRGATL